MSGIIRRIDDLGRVVIPKENRTALGIKEGDPVEIIQDGKVIHIKKYTDGCFICGSDEDLIVVEDIKMCRRHATMIAERLGK